MSNPIRRTVLPPLEADAVRRWAAADPATELDALNDLRRDVAAITRCVSNFIDDLPENMARMIDTRVKASQSEMRAAVAEA